MSAPPMRHAHAVSLSPASPPDVFRPHSHAHQPGHVHRQGENHDREPAVDVVSGQVAHYHLAWLFIDISVPIQRPEQDDAGESGLGLPPTVVATQVVADFRPGLLGDIPIMSAADSQCDFEVCCGVRLAASTALNMLRCGPLSDGARRERTGVQTV